MNTDFLKAIYIYICLSWSILQLSSIVYFINRSNNCVGKFDMYAWLSKENLHLDYFIWAIITYGFENMERKFGFKILFVKYG